MLCYVMLCDNAAASCQRRHCGNESASISAIISLELHVRASSIFVHVTYGRGSVLLWRCSNTLHVSAITDDVIFCNKLRRLDGATGQWHDRLR